MLSHFSHVWLFVTPWTVAYQAPGSLVHGDFPGKSTGVGSHFLLLYIHIKSVYVLSHFHCVGLFATPCTVACQAPLSMEFPRQEYWSGVSFPSPGDLPHPGIKSISFKSPVLAGKAGSLVRPKKPSLYITLRQVPKKDFFPLFFKSFVTIFERVHPTSHFSNWYFHRLL